MLTHVTACLDIWERIVKSMSMIASIIHAKMEALALISSTAIRVFVEFRLQAKTAKLKWTHARPIDANMEPNVHQAQTIKTFTVHVQLGTLEDFVMKTLMNASNRHRHAEMELLAETQMVLINVSVRRDMKAKIVQSTLTIAPISHAKMEAHVWMELAITRACAMMVLKVNIVKKTSMSVFHSHVLTAQLAISM
jgi:hypothetical protein